MKLLVRLLFLFVSAVSLFADDAVIASVRAADDERVAATLAADPARLDAILSEALHYAHSNGKLDDKASFIGSLVSKNVLYESISYPRRDFAVVGSGIVLMTGRAVMQASSAGRKVVLDLNFLAVWREEGGKWRLLAWQSCNNPPPAAK